MVTIILEEQANICVLESIKEEEEKQEKREECVCAFGGGTFIFICTACVCVCSYHTLLYINAATKA